jgi:hypothetical protein
MRNLEEFNGKFTGRIGIVIGAGPSIADVDVELLRDHVTIAVNSGYCAVPWADFFVSDDWSVAHWSYYFRDLRQSDSTIALLYDEKLSKTAGWFGDRAVLFKHRKGISIPDVYSHTNKKNFIGETRTSVGSAMMIAHVMGCSKIALLGIDGTRRHGFRYFWQTLSKQPYRNDNVPVDRYRKVKTAGQITDHDLLEINRSWHDFGTAMNEKCSVYNCSEDSALNIFPKASLRSVLDARDS